MAKSIFKKAKISAMSYAMPNIMKTIEENIDCFDNSIEQLNRAKKVIGYGYRYISPDHITITDIMEQAAQELLKNIDKLSIDMIICVTQMPDFAYPGSSFIIHNRLGLSHNCSAIDIPHGCSGFIYGLHTAFSFVESGAYKKILLIAGDNETENKNANKATKLLFSSGACAALIEQSEKDNLSYFYLGSLGKSYESLIIPAGGEKIPITKDILNTTVYDNVNREWYLNKPFMDGMQVFEFTMQVIPQIIEDILSFSKYSIDDIDFFAIHQANKQIIKTITSKLGITSKKYSAETFSKYGNTTTTSCVLNLLDIKGEYIKNNTINTALVSFGTGLSFGTVIMNIGNIYYDGIKQYSFDNYKQSSAYLNEWIDKVNNKKYYSIK